MLLLLLLWWLLLIESSGRYASRLLKCADLEAQVVAIIFAQLVEQRAHKLTDREHHDRGKASHRSYMPSLKRIHSTPAESMQVAF